MIGSGKDYGVNGGGDRGDFSQLKAKVIWMSLGFHLFNLVTIWRKVEQCF